MIRIAIVFLLTCLSGCACLSDGRASGGVAMRVLSVDVSGRYPVATLRLINGSDRPFQYLGYTPTILDPQVATEVRSSQGWLLVNTAFCDAGIGGYVLSPGESVVLTVDVRNHWNGHAYQTARIVLREASGDRVVHSPPFFIDGVLAQ